MPTLISLKGSDYISYYDDNKEIMTKLQMEAARLQLLNKGLGNEGEIFRLMLQKAFHEGRMYEIIKSSND